MRYHYATSSGRWRFLVVGRYKGENIGKQSNQKIKKTIKGRKIPRFNMVGA
jgi:hypothetical protein